MRNIKLVIEYDGTGFVGWQTQPNGRSVQEELTRVLEQMLQEQVTVTGSGRTDAGVHATGQVANFRTGSPMVVAALMNGLNGLLPADVRIHSAAEVPEDFSARYSARDRRYRYVISTVPSAIGRFYKWFVKFDLDIGAMNDAAAMVIGEHDFTSFSKLDPPVRHYRCTVLSSSWELSGPQLLYSVRANRFMHGMVRALVGTMVDVGRGYTFPQEFRAIMEAKDRNRAGMSAPPHGLFLEEVRY